jgi:serine/threonine protein kinase
MGSSELQIQTDNGQIGMPNSVCCVVVEYLPGGALKSYLIKNRRRKLAFKVVIQLALDLARGYPPSVSRLVFVNLLFFVIFVVPFQK